MFGGRNRDAESRGGFVEVQPHEVAQFYQLPFAQIEGGELFQGLVQREQLVVVRHGGGDLDSVHIHHFGTGTAFGGDPAAGAFNEDATHRLGGGPEEVGPALPVGLFIRPEPKPCLVDERRGLEGVAGGFAGHLVRGQFAQLFIDNRKQFLRGPGIAAPDGSEQMGDVRHGPSVRSPSPKRQPAPNYTRHAVARNVELMKGIIPFGTAAREAIPGLKELINELNAQCDRGEFPKGALNNRRVGDVMNAITAIEAATTQPELRTVPAAPKRDALK